MSPLKSLIARAEEWKKPLSGIEEVVEERFDMLPSEFFEESIIPIVLENEDHLFHKLFLGMMWKSGGDYEDLEDYLLKKQEELDYFECQNDEIPPFWQKIIYKFICDEYPID